MSTRGDRPNFKSRKSERGGVYPNKRQKSTVSNSIDAKLNKNSQTRRRQVSKVDLRGKEPDEEVHHRKVD